MPDGLAGDILVINHLAVISYGNEILYSPRDHIEDMNEEAIEWLNKHPDWGMANN
jgi:hypothetical protein